jgi:PHS family inorganic phosphate transporter-like MFS transporter
LQHFRQWKNLKVLIGCSVSWFALDVAFYGINLNTSIIISSIGFSGNLKTNSTVEIWESMFSNTVGNIIGKLISLEFKVYF